MAVIGGEVGSWGRLGRGDRKSMPPCNAMAIHLCLLFLAGALHANRKTHISENLTVLYIFKVLL